MEQNQKQSIIKEFIKEMKGDYKVPGKLFAWGLVVGQWMTIVIIGSIFLAVLVYFIMMAFEPRKNAELESTNTMPSITEQGKIKSEQELVAHLKEIAELMRVSTKSVNERQQIIETLTKDISSYVGRTLDKDQLESRLKSFSSTLSRCNQYRGMYMDMFAKNINPFEDPRISRAFDELVVGHFFTGNHVLDPQEENKQWEVLCEFCRQEANKAKDELVQTLKGGEGAQAEGAAAQTSFFK